MKYGVYKVLGGKRTKMTDKEGPDAERTARDFADFLERTASDGARYVVVPQAGRSKEAEEAFADQADARARVLIEEVAAQAAESDADA